MSASNMLYDSAIRLDPALPEPLKAALEVALAGPPERVRRVAAGGQAVWLKQTEQLSLRWRLQKGNTRRAFEADRLALQDLSALGLPVPDLVAVGPDFFATLEAGEPLSRRMETPLGPWDPEIEGPLQAAGRALGRLHAAGIIHGRPKLRDICWDGKEIRLIDFERYRRGESSVALMAQDMLVLLHSLFTLRPEGAQEAGTLLQAWRAEVGEAPAQALLAPSFRLKAIALLARLVLKLRPQSRETRATLLTLNWLARQRG